MQCTVVTYNEYNFGGLLAVISFLLICICVAVWYWRRNNMQKLKDKKNTSVREVLVEILPDEVFVVTSIAKAARSYHLDPQCPALGRATAQVKSAALCKICRDKAEFTVVKPIR